MPSPETLASGRLGRSTKSRKSRASSRAKAQPPAELDAHPVPEPLRAFVALRGRPAVFVVVNEPIQRKHLLRLRQELGDRRYEELDFVIHSGGGDINIAYLMVQLIRQHTDRMNACVPLYAKSAATLWCLAANQIVMDESAELGPLDTQIREEERGGKVGFVSALNPFKTLEQLRDFSLETLDSATRMIAGRSGLDLNDSLEHAIRFVQATTTPLFAKLDPATLGAYSRALAIGSEYGDRLLSRSTDWDKNRREQVLDKLVRGYPTHEYIIDYTEMKDMGFSVALFDENERESVDALLYWMLSEATAVRLLEPPSDTLGHSEADTPQAPSQPRPS